MLTLLTATGARPQAWALCERWMTHQTYDGPVRWVIVDDGPEPQPITFGRHGWSIEVIRPQPFWSPGKNTQARNLLAGLAVIEDRERVVFVEDDDYYAPAFLEHIARWLDRADLVGESMAVYYNIERRVWRNCGNKAHAGLCSTGARDGAVKLFRRVCQTNHKFLDLELWRRYRGSRLLVPTSLCVGTKGLPGRGGIGSGHRLAAERGAQPDPDGSKLRELIGDDARLYG